MEPDNYYEARMEDHLAEVGAADEFIPNDGVCPYCEKDECQCEGEW